MGPPTASAPKLPFGSMKVHGQDASPLFGLPGELRNRIYRLVLLEQNAIQVVDTGYARPGLLTTCQQIANESTVLYYEENKFDVRAWDYNPHSLYNFERGINALAERGHSMKPKMRLAVMPSSTNWKNVMKVSPQTPDITGFTTIRVMFSTVKAFKGRASWNTVEEVLKAHRKILISLKPAWADD
ncbi:hypothetical protein CBER1_00176 [Cercospora berteroae]|uniref:Uncharacterized protein n=1 Tax=Cercospora berteroae TaxID=357750 RepID=A0A2S6CDK8_9PEZI|nr:hypothetical protein CBER1_00176 [Cercospora berteroae]